MNANLSGYTALSPRDVSDARRGRPAVDLSWYAAERGLQALGNSTAEGYIAAMPGEAALQDFSIADGTSPLGHRESLAYRGLHGWHLAADRAPQPGLVERLLAGPLLRALQATAEQRPCFELIVRRGALSVRTNGYLNDPDELDWLATVLSIAASELREACLAVADRRPFAVMRGPIPGTSLTGRVALHGGFHRRDPTRRAPLGDVAALVDRAVGLARALKLV